MSYNLDRKIKKSKEKQELDNIQKTYGKKPKGICPRCKRKSLFMANKDGEIYCIRCDNLIKRTNSNN